MSWFGVNDSFGILDGWILDVTLDELDWSETTWQRGPSIEMVRCGYLGPLNDRCISLCFSTSSHDYVDLSARVVLSQPQSANLNRQQAWQIACAVAQSYARHGSLTHQITLFCLASMQQRE